MSGTVGKGLQELLGHRDGRMTERYTHTADPYLADAVERVHFGAAMGGPDATVEEEAGAALQGGKSAARLAPIWHRPGPRAEKPSGPKGNRTPVTDVRGRCPNR